jgi:hypothetical protein
MKMSILFILLCLSGASVFAQSGFEVKSYFGVSGTHVGHKEDLIGLPSVSMEGFKELGFLLSHGIGQKLMLNAGLNYSYSTVQFTPSPCPNCTADYLYAHNPDFEMLSFPIFAEYGLGNFFYAAGGPILDFQLSEGNNISAQSGLGYLVGLGGKVKIEKISFTVFPNYKRHSVINFEKQQGSKDILQEFGVQFGVGYKF